MFVICYLLAALTTIAAVLIGGALTGHSLWENLGMALLAAVFLQVLILGYVIAATIGNTRGSRGAVPVSARESRHQLFTLPK